MGKKIQLVGNLGRSLPAVTINDTELRVIEYHGQRVVTLAQVDAVHQRPSGTARKRFNDNRARLIEGEDFFEITQPSEIRTLGLSRPQGGTSGKVVLLAETGYLMLVKSFGDDLAWQVQRKLVTAYFRRQHSADPAPAVPYVVGRSDSLTHAEQDKLRNTIYDARDQLHADQQGAFTTQAWSKLKAHFHYKPGQNYRNIPRAQFGEALALIERHVAEFEPSSKAPVAIGHVSPGALLAAASDFAAWLATAPPMLVQAARLGIDAANEPTPPMKKAR